jgi:uncharacterized protein (DUF3084 family)
VYGVILVIVLIVSGGLIAVIGDRIGMKVGRKKLSLFGLRPKHTSMIVTVTTGILIATATLLVLSVSSRNVRLALFHMDEIRNRLKNTQAELLKTTREVRKKEKIANALANQIDNLIRQKSVYRSREM